MCRPAALGTLNGEGCLGAVLLAKFWRLLRRRGNRGSAPCGYRVGAGVGAEMGHRGARAHCGVRGPSWSRGCAWKIIALGRRLPYAFL